MAYRFRTFINKFLSHNVTLSLHSNDESSIWVEIGECVCPNKIVIFSMCLNKKHGHSYMKENISQYNVYRHTNLQSSSHKVWHTLPTHIYMNKFWNIFDNGSTLPIWHFSSVSYSRRKKKQANKFGNEIRGTTAYINDSLFPMYQLRHI